MRANLLHAVAKLHTGALIVDQNDIIFAITAEAYARAKSIDVHGVTNMKSHPTASNCRYGSLSVGVHEEADGNAVKRKLKIGSKSMNVLITLSARLQTSPCVDIGPETSATRCQIHPS